VLRFDQVDICHFIPVTDKHDPPVEEEVFTEFAEIDHRWGQTQFLQSAQHGFGYAVLTH